MTRSIDLSPFWGQWEKFTKLQARFGHRGHGKEGEGTNENNTKTSTHRQQQAIPPFQFYYLGAKKTQAGVEAKIKYSEKSL